MSKRVKFIKKHYPDTHNRKMCCQILGISEDFFDAICYHNGIERVNDYWTEEQEAYLLKWYGKKSPDEISKAIGRKRHSIHNKTHQLGLTQ